MYLKGLVIGYSQVTQCLSIQITQDIFRLPRVQLGYLGECLSSYQIFQVIFRLPMLKQDYLGYLGHFVKVRLSCSELRNSLWNLCICILVPPENSPPSLLELMCQMMYCFLSPLTFRYTTLHTSQGNLEYRMVQGVQTSFE